MATGLSKKAQAEAEQAEALRNLRKMLADVDEIRTVVTHVSSSGMYRVFLVVVAVDNKVHNITGLVCSAGIAKWDRKHYGAGLSGVGMDMGFALVYNIGRAVIGDAPWQCRGDHGPYGVRCPSNEHVNEPRVEYGPHITHDSDGGYRFAHRAL